VVVTHDRWFLDRIASRILAFEGGARVVAYPGNYDTFRRLRAEARAQAESAAESSVPSAPPREVTRAKQKRADAAKPEQLSRKEEQELAGLPDAIERLEQRIQELNLQLSDPSLYAGTSSGAAAAEATAELSRVQAELERLMARWEELERKRAGS
jgi:ATP-binding cassette subfamily F protein uup